MRIEPLDYASLAVGSLFVAQQNGFFSQATDPGAAPLNSGYLYAKEVAGESELFWEDDLGNVEKITGPGGPAPGNATYFLQTANAGLPNADVIGSSGPTSITDSLTYQWNDAVARTVSYSQLGVGSIALAIGTNPALSGAFRLANAAWIAARNAANSGDVNLIRADASDRVAFGANVAAFTMGGAISGNSQNANGWSQVQSTSIFVGAANWSATAGTYNMPNATYIMARNAANSGDIAMIQIDGSNHVLFGVNVAAFTMAGAIALGANNITGGGTFTGSAAILGTTPAAAGVLRLPNNTFETFRNAANSADINAWKVNASNVLEPGVNINLNAQTISQGTNPATTGVLNVPNNITAIAARNAANTLNFGLIFLDGTNRLILGDAANLPPVVFSGGIQGAYASADATFDLGLTASTGRFRDAFLSSSVSAGTTPATSGVLRIPNAAALSARNAANSANIIIAQLTGGDLVQFGANLAAFTLGGAVTGNGQTIIGISQLQVNGTSMAMTGAVNTNPQLQISTSGTGLSQLVFVTADVGWIMQVAANGDLSYTATGIVGGVISLVKAGSIANSIVVNAGAIRMAKYGAGAATFDASGNITSVSDERLKNISGMFSRGLDAVMGIKPITYYWNEESRLETEHEYVGFSAQNIQEFIPEAIGVSPDGYLSLNDRGIVAALVNSVQELTLRVRELEGLKGR